jgi:hypothetical protein
VVVDRHAGGDGLSGGLFGQAIRRNEGHFPVLGGTAESPDDLLRTVKLKIVAVRQRGSFGRLPARA